ncbi:hypothetical protein NUH30_19500 [Leptospira sp. 85282-16]|uniref:hypothetical protein n=1 Tax=Leptospira sp. 85282-16 TaxID=2971256 RepID=UPI0021BFA00D|nr:hypothetical protein [Leptospira sp. 85282-16]MCT8335882.1 hypothetical protein [Leptospira sp. 85282-16]
MCFTVYLGSNIILPEIKWNENNPQFFTQQLSKEELNIKNHFIYPEVIYLGSDESCGCGFRHALLNYDENSWLEVVDTEEDKNEQKNHNNLVSFIKKNLTDEKYCELYSIWDEDFKQKPLIFYKISLNDIQDQNFFFKERAFYKCKIS